ncbi:hypothetical protein GCM10009647_089740 [Streptomyces sanglieri]
MGGRGRVRESGLALFDAFASKEKTLHANAGKHFGFPRFEADSAARVGAACPEDGAAEPECRWSVSDDHLNGVRLGERHHVPA